MSVVSYKCPCCGAALAYAGASGKLECASCGNSYDLEAIEALNMGEDSSIEFEAPKASYSSQDVGQMQAFVCESCGAELVTDGTTTATTCAYCGSPAILPEQIRGGVKPEKVVPFKLSKEEATRIFQDYFKGKRLLPNFFSESRNRIAEMRKLYVPYWLFDCDAEADITFDAKDVRISRQGDYEVTRTRYYSVRRAGRIGFDAIPVDGSEKLDNKITESLEPYDLSEAVDFEPAVLAGALADRADVDAEACEARAAERVEESTVDALRSTVTGYDTVTLRRKHVHAQNGKITPVLMPVWLITTEKVVKGERHVYTFAINGQTGELTCNVPYSKGKAAAWFFGVFAGVFAVGMLLMSLLG